MTRIVLVVLLAAATGCADAIMFGTGTMVGIEVKPAQDGQTEVNFAYSRQEIAVFPMRFPAEDGEPAGASAGQNPDSLAYSVYAWFRLTNRWLVAANPMDVKRGVCVRQIIATGRAAKNLAGLMRDDTTDPCRETQGGD